MPAWLRLVATLNPLTYMVDALRALMIAGAPSRNGVAVDIGVLAVVLVVLVAIGGRLYPRLAQ
jgi:ABC-2 type transport system permease protein